MSFIEFVIAPYPHVFATPATVVEWQMRAWWSQLLLPHRLIHLRSRYDCSLLCFDEPTTKTESTPLCFLSSSILGLISFSAWSHEIRSYLLPTSFIGVLSRYSPCPCSRSAAPFAH